MSLFALFYMLFAYLLGSISSAILICRLTGLPDPRQNGSHNPGATNVLRIGNRKSALAVLIFDMLKGMIPVWAGYYLGLTQFELGMVALGACLGHIFPIFFNLKVAKVLQLPLEQSHRFLGRLQVQCLVLGSLFFLLVAILH